ncbi:MAG: peptide deformylase [Candidatus Micrarchaeota archaeon]
MAVREVLMIGNPELRRKSSEVINFDDGLAKIVSDLRDTLTHLQKIKRVGRALAAPQIGHLKRAIYMQIPERTLVMVNPDIIQKSEEMLEVWDSCFSFDVAFFVKIKRHKKIKVKYFDEKGNLKTEEFEGALSELFQHEIDHLDGILATDHLKDNKQISMRQEWERRYR